jgi:flagellar basal body-associated protein FliL
MGKTILIIAIGVFLILAGVYGAYVFGKEKGISEGISEGRSALLAEQQKATEEAAKQAQEKLLEEVNPFKETETVNPLNSNDFNPFKETTEYINPFAQ